MSSLQAAKVRLPIVPVHAERVVSYALPIVSTSTVPVMLGVEDHHTVLVLEFTLSATQGGVGSVASVVADELSTVFVPELLSGIALAKLSFAGGVAVTVSDCADDPPPVAPGFATVTETSVPKATFA